VGGGMGGFVGRMKGGVKGEGAFVRIIWKWASDI